MTKMLLAQRLLAIAGWQEALGMHKNLVLSRNGQKGASCADAMSGGCKSNKNFAEKGPRVGVVDWCCGKEQCGGRLVWHSVFGRSENGSEMLHMTGCIC